MKIDGKTVLITGASSGIGAACAEAFAAERCRLILVARRAERLHEVASALNRQRGVEVMIATVDVRDRQRVDAWVAELPAAWAEIDVLVNNAGLARGLGPLHEGLARDWEEMIDTNVKGLLWVTRAVLPGMVQRRSGHVINIGSVAGHEVYAGGNVYCGTKHAVAAISRSLGIDLLGSGIRVSSVDPGLVETEFSIVRFHGDESRAEAVYDGLDPLTGQDVAEAVIFCATRPPNANVREMVLLAGAQASASQAFRRS